MVGRAPTPRARQRVRELLCGTAVTTGQSTAICGLADGWAATNIPSISKYIGFRIVKINGFCISNSNDLDSYLDNKITAGEAIKLAFQNRRTRSHIQSNESYQA